MRGVILDTNFLMIPASLKVDIFAELDRVCNFPYEICVIDKTSLELDNIEKTQKGKHKRAAMFAKALLGQKKIKVVETGEGHADDLILKAAKEKNFIVATQDMALKRKLKDNGISRIFLRQKKYLVLEM